MKNYGVIVADVVGSTSIPLKDKLRLIKEVKLFLGGLDKRNIKSRVVKGDQLELVLNNPADSLRIGILLKAFTKAQYQMQSEQNASRRLYYFGKYALRMAIAVDEMNRTSDRSNIWEGQAIYNAGRAIDNDHTYNAEKIVIKSTMEFVSGNKDWEQQFDVIVKLIDELLARATPRQCEILVQRLLNKSEDEIRKALQISQSAVNQALKSAGWRVISNAINYFEATIR